MNRRTFLKKVIKTFFLILSAVSTYIFSVFIYPRKVRKKTTVYFFACDEDALPVRGVRQIYVKYTVREKTVNSKIFFVNTGKELFALSPVCSHLGCLVNWHRPKKRFICPCHGGRYDINGAVVEGPPPAPLSRLPLKIENAKAYIGLRV